MVLLVKSHLSFNLTRGKFTFKRLHWPRGEPGFFRFIVYFLSQQQQRRRPLSFFSSPKQFTLVICFISASLYLFLCESMLQIKNRIWRKVLITLCLSKKPLKYFYRPRVSVSSSVTVTPSQCDAWRHRSDWNPFTAGYRPKYFWNV